MEYGLKLKNKNQLQCLADLIDHQLGIYAGTVMMQTDDGEGRTIDNAIRRNSINTKLEIPFRIKANLDILEDIGEPVYQILHPIDKQKEYIVRLTSEEAKEKITPEVFERIKKEVYKMH